MIFKISAVLNWEEFAWHSFWCQISKKYEFLNNQHLTLFNNEAKKGFFSVKYDVTISQSSVIGTFYGGWKGQKY